MPQASQVQRHAGSDPDLFIEFNDELQEPFGSLQVRTEEAEDHFVCRAEWGGWQWRAEGHDRVSAQRRLGDRLSRLDPFLYADADWGHPGYQTGALDESIPPRTRARMREHTQREARSAVGLLEAVFEAQARRPWAYPASSDEVAPGVEVEGYVTASGDLALFPRTFYDIANAYFGRSTAPGAVRPKPGEVPLNGGWPTEHPGLAGALRRLNEKGYMRSADGRLPHQIQSIEVYVFTPNP